MYVHALLCCAVLRRLFLIESSPSSFPHFHILTARTDRDEDHIDNIDHIDYLDHSDHAYHIDHVDHIQIICLSSWYVVQDLCGTDPTL